MIQRILTCVVAVALAVPVGAEAAPGESCFAAVAATHGFKLGLPQQATVTPDGRTVLYVRSGGRDTRLRLFAFDVASGKERALAAPPAGAEVLSVEEKARRERARMTLSGITDFSLSRDGRVVLVSEAGRLASVDVASGRERGVAGDDWIAPELSPDGNFVAAVRGNDLHVVALGSGRDRQVTTGGSETLTHGLPEFVASEELDREDGSWWSPDGRTLLFEESDTSGVEPHWIADPGHPERAPVEFRYPAAGTANARVRLGLIGRDGGGAVRWVDWDSGAFPYLVRVVWPQGRGKLTLVVMNRAQTEQRLLTVDPATGHATLLLAETDAAWINTSPGLDWKTQALPRWLADGSGFFWASDKGGDWRLGLYRADGTLENWVTPAGMNFLSLDDVDAGGGTVSVLAAADADPIDAGVYRVGLHGGAVRAVAVEPGQHEARFGAGEHGVFVDRYDGADGRVVSRVRDAGGRVLGTLPSEAEMPPAVHVTFETVGETAGETVAETAGKTAGGRFDAAVLRPSGFVAGTRYPVVLSVYAGPEVKVVLRTPSRFAEDQCLADRGFVVVSLDGRGTPLHGHDWERAIKNDLIDAPLDDQVAGLRALGVRHPEMDMSRVGVTGWSFGGFFTAMATIRRPDVFAVGVAGAPPTEWANYDTAYTERYLGTPAADPGGYETSNVTTYAGALARPLLIIHGLTDDNVYFVNSFELTEALLKAGKPYDLLLLPGTHLLPDPLLRARVDEARAGFLGRYLH